MLMITQYLYECRRFHFTECLVNINDSTPLKVGRGAFFTKINAIMVFVRKGSSSTSKIGWQTKK